MQKQLVLPAKILDSTRGYFRHKVCTNISAGSESVWIQNSTSYLGYFNVKNVSKFVAKFESTPTSGLIIETPGYWAAIVSGSSSGTFRCNRNFPYTNAKMWTHQYPDQNKKIPIAADNIAYSISKSQVNELIIRFNQRHKRQLLVDVFGANEVNGFAHSK